MPWPSRILCSPFLCLLHNVGVNGCAPPILANLAQEYGINDDPHSVFERIEPPIGSIGNTSTAPIDSGRCVSISPKVANNWHVREVLLGSLFALLIEKLRHNARCGLQQIGDLHVCQ